MDGIICFSVRFCDNSLLVLKMRFQVFFFLQAKMVFIYKNVSQFFEILIFRQDIWGNDHYVPESNLISYKNLIKSVVSPEQNKLKEI